MTDTLKLEIGGMSCQHCVKAVRGALETLDGVEVERVDVGSAVVRFDPSHISANDIADAVNDAGYAASPA